MNANDVEELVIHALGERAGDDPWRQLCCREQTPDEVIALRRGQESAPQVAHKLELFAPMSDGLRDQTLQMLLSRYYPTADTEADSGPAKGSGPASNVRSLSDRAEHARRRQLVIVGALVAMAAAVVLLLSLRDSTPEHSSGGGMEPMPGFELLPRNGDSGQMRGDPPAPRPKGKCDVEYRPDDVLFVDLKPHKPLLGVLAVAAYAHTDNYGGRWLNLDPARQSAKGVLTIEQPLKELGLGEDTWTITFYVTRVSQRWSEQELRTLPPGIHPGATVVVGTLCIRR